MSDQELVNQSSQPPSSQITLEKASYDLASLKLQMMTGFALVLIACFVSYWSTLKVGFLLDDFLHLNYVAQAQAGHWQGLLHNFYGNWADSDIMKSYRPLSSLSFFVDYLFWKTNALGFHLTNILLLFGSAFFVALIVLEVTGLSGNRLGTACALWAALLFAVYPLHPEACAWAIGRVDLLCSLFYLASIHSYLRFRLIREPVYLWASLVCFVLALASKEMAATLPAVIALAELLLVKTTWKGEAKDYSIAKFKYVGLFFIALALYAAFRTALLGAVVGGYGEGGLSVFANSWRVFLDKASLVKIILPMNEEVQFASFVKPASLAIYAGALVIFLFRLVAGSTKVRPFLFLLCWAVVAILPTIQVWHIYPNLVGSRLFFISSAPLCMLLALLLLPAVDAMKRRQAIAVTAIGTLLLTLLFGLWSYELQGNLQPWITAGKQMETLLSQVRTIARETPDGKHVLLLDLPRDFSGAGMLTRPQYLAIAAKPPFSEVDYASRLVTIEPPISGSHDYIWPQNFKQMIVDPNNVQAYLWDRTSGQFQSFAKADGNDQFTFAVTPNNCRQLKVIPENASWGEGNNWHVMSSKLPSLVRFADHLRIYPGSTGVTLYFPDVDLNPLSANFASADFALYDSRGCTTCMGAKVRFVWKSSFAGGDAQASAGEVVRGEHLAWLGRYRAWTLSSTIKEFGLRLEPGEYFIDFRGVRLFSDAKYVPSFVLSQNAINYDVSKIANAHGVQLLVSPVGTTFDSANETDMTAAKSGTAGERDSTVISQNGVKGKINLPNDFSVASTDPNSSGSNTKNLRQVRIVAVDQYGLPVGFPSEPLTLYF
jgi:hypothetical protein